MLTGAYAKHVGGRIELLHHPRRPVSASSDTRSPWWVLASATPPPGRPVSPRRRVFVTNPQPRVRATGSPSINLPLYRRARGIWSRVQGFVAVVGASGSIEFHPCSLSLSNVWAAPGRDGDDFRAREPRGLPSSSSRSPRRAP